MAYGNIDLTGNRYIKTALKSMSNMSICCEALNTSDAILFSKYGDITIRCKNASICGLIYAPFGNVTISSETLNLNSVVIIAQTVTLEAPSININYSKRAGDIIGLDSEPLDIPVEEWVYMKDENENTIPDFFEIKENYSKLLDTDGDTLPDVIEKYLGTDPQKSDSDDDTLPDNYELNYTRTSPLQKDTNANGILDSNEDLDKDSLSNYMEYLNNTDPNGIDTDNDGLTDGEELSIYKTNPNESDSDNDKLSDGDEKHLQTDPLNPDTNENGILDGDEKFYQQLACSIEDIDSPITQVTIAMECNGNINSNTSIDSIMEDDIICKEVEGLIGEPFEITSDAQFDKATITFQLNPANLNTDLENILFLWYNEEKCEFVELETTCDKTNSSVSIETEHFSKYMIVDKNEWFNAWTKELKYNNNPDKPQSFQSYNTVLAIDCSGSMSTNDPIRIMNGSINCQRVLAAKEFIHNMDPEDKVSIVLFTSSAKTQCKLTNDKDLLISSLQKITSSGGTYFDNAIKESLENFDDSSEDICNKIILLSDGGSDISDSILNKAKSKNVSIYTVGLGDYSDDTMLEYISDTTGGNFYKAITANELVDIYAQAGIKLNNLDKTDNDHDGLYDILETVGIRLLNGKIIHTDPTNPDSDGDGLKDGEEINTLPIAYSKTITVTGASLASGSTVKGYYFEMKSSPNKKDSDNDFIEDAIDAIPLSVNYTQKELKSKAAKVIKENANYIKDAANYYNISPCIAAACIFTEQDLNYDWKDKYLDGIIGFYGILDTSIGLGQVRISTAKFVEKKGYVPKCNASDGGWDIPFFGHLNGTKTMVREKRLENNEWNTIYVSAYLTYFWDTWKGDFPTLKKRPDIWATLYNLGHEQTKPHSNPKANDFGKHADKYYDMMYLLLYR